MPERQLRSPGSDVSPAGRVAGRDGAAWRPFYRRRERRLDVFCYAAAGDETERVGRHARGRRRGRRSARASRSRSS